MLGNRFVSLNWSRFVFAASDRKYVFEDEFRVVDYQLLFGKGARAPPPNT